MTLTTYALWGAGDLDPRSAAVILSEYMPSPDDVGDIYRPDRVPREHKGMRAAIDYLESPDYAGQGLSPSTDVLASLKDARDTEGDDVVLLALWPEAPTREDFALIRSFEAEGIPVKDLSRTLDDLDLSLYTEPPPPKEPRKSRAKAPVVKLSEGVADAPAGYSDGDNAPDEVVAFTSPSMATAATTMVVTMPEEVNLEEAMVAVFGVEQARMIDDYINYKIRKAMVHRTVPVAGNPCTEVDLESGINHDDMDRPPFDGPYVDIHTSQYYSNAERNIRPAEGKPRRGEFVVNLTPEEVTLAQEEGRYRG